MLKSKNWQFVVYYPTVEGGGISKFGEAAIFEDGSPAVQR